MGVPHSTDALPVAGISAAEPREVHNPLRVGILLPTSLVPAWQHRCIESIAKLASVRGLVLLRGNGACHPNGSGASAVFRAWNRLDGWLFGDYARTENLEISYPRRGLSVDLCTFNPADLASVKAAQCDVIIDFDGCSCPADLANYAPYGVWGLAIDGFTGAAGEHALFRRMSARDSTFEVSVSARTPRGSCTLCRAVYQVDRLSLHRMQMGVLYDAAELFARALREAARVPLEDLEYEIGEGRTNVRPITSMHMARFLGTWITAAVAGRIRRCFWRPRWFLAFRSRRGLGQFSVLMAPPHHFYADPFVVERGARTFIFFEDYDQRIGKGVISVVEVDALGKCSRPQMVLERPYHVSYPFLLEWGGELYLIPESRQNGTIDAYSCTDFPHGWKLRYRLMEGVSAVDPTILEHEGNLYLFAAGFGSPGSECRDLHVFFSDALPGPWYPHPKNPVVCDVRRARPAGKPFFSARGLIRPGQDCSRIYGGAVVLNQVQALSKVEYREVPLDRIGLGADWLPSGHRVHTFNSGMNVEVIDAQPLFSLRSTPQLRTETHLRSRAEP